MTLGRVSVAEDNARPIREVRWSARRKMEAVLRLLREPPDVGRGPPPGATSSSPPAPEGLKGPAPRTRRAPPGGR